MVPVSLFEVSVLLLSVAVSGLHVLQPVLDHLLAISPRNPLASAAAGALFALPITYFTGIILVFLQIAPVVPPALLSPAALRLVAVAAMACALLLLAVMPLVPWL